MNSRLFPAALLFASLIIPVTAAEPELSLEISNARVRAKWTTPPSGRAQALSTRRWQIERSTTLQGWLPEGAAVVVGPGQSGVQVLDMSPQGTHGFFRLKVTEQPAFLASGGAEVMGFVSEMDARMAANSTVDPNSIPAMFPPGACLPQVSYDVFSSEYWPEWDMDPAVWNAPLPVNSPDRRLTDFRLDANERLLLQRNGFVVSEARGAPGFTDLYYRIWTDDLPVYVSSDSLLHAWHRTWITMLEELEELALRPRLTALVSGVRNQLLATTAPAALAQAKADVQSFLTTANSLASYLGTSPVPSPASQYGRAVAASAVNVNESFFGGTRIMDWTQFGPRAHYTNSETLKSYFRTMMLLAQVDMRLDERVTPGGELRQLAAACVLTLALHDAGLMDEWEEMDGILTPFTGQADALTPPQLLEILTAEGLGSLNNFTGTDKLETLLARITSGQAGVQQITGHPIPAPLSETKLVLPRSFVFFPQRFTPESWAFTRMVFDNIWRENPDPSGPPMVRIRRRLPSALDINFAVLGNNTPAALLSQRMGLTTGVPFRDGYDFSRELVSVRQVMDAMPASAWSGSLYLHGLDTLRSLSAPLPATVPAAMRTEAWKWKTVQTQLASWTELRHDNLLYAKQSYTPPVLCDYPAGYVEPRPEFYAALQRMAAFARTTVAAIPMSGIYPGRPVPEPNYPDQIDLASRKTQWLAQFQTMSDTFGTLQSLAVKELAQQPFNQTETDFLKSLVQSVYEPYAPNNGRTYSGWYPKLYLKSAFAGPMDAHPSEMWDPIVADIHTDGPDAVAGDPGAVLYNATGNAALLLVCIDVNGRQCLHGGPAFTYYEFTGPYSTTRLNDQTWKTQVRSKLQPAPPSWTAAFLQPGPIEVPAGQQ